MLIFWVAIQWKKIQKTMTQLSGLSNHCSCVREGSLGAGRMKTTLPGSISGHCRWYQTITRFLPTRKRKTLYQRIPANWMLKETHREPGKPFILHCSINAVHPQGMLNSSSSGQGSHVFCRHPGVVRRREYFWVEGRFPRSPEICQRSQANGICFF